MTILLVLEWQGFSKSFFEENSLYYPFVIFEYLKGSFLYSVPIDLLIYFHINNKICFTFKSFFTIIVKVCVN